ncbi:MAG: TatD family hydrolase [Erysipelothrix sp.]|nr:TatD family hydrolase [Erysipelothrix sp.]
MNNYWIDSHAHIVSEGLIEDFDDIIHNAIENNIGKICIICGSLKQVEEALKRVEGNTMFDLAVGIHPTTVHERSEEEFLAMMAYLDHPQVVAVGEIGLDYYWDETYKVEQNEMFIRQIEYANQHKLPIIVHMRNSWEDIYTTLKDNLVNETGVIHCFSEGVDEANKFLDLGYYLGFGGILTFKNGDNVRDVLSVTPKDRVLSETDSPYLAPVPKRGKRNEPAHVMYVGEKIGELQKEVPDSVKSQIIENYQRLFKKSK